MKLGLFALFASMILFFEICCIIPYRNKTRKNLVSWFIYSSAHFKRGHMQESLVDPTMRGRWRKCLIDYQKGVK